MRGDPAFDEEAHVQEREVLEVIQTLVAEERRLRRGAEEGTLSEVDAARLERTSLELADTWRTLRAVRAEREAARADEGSTVDLREPGIIAS